MDRLNFTLPDFCRVNWVSEQARAHWQPRIAHGASLCHELELETVVAGNRAAGLIGVAEGELEVFSKRCLASKLELRPLYGFTPKTGYISDFSAQHAGAEMQMCAVGHATDARAAEAAFRRRDTATLAELFGYPSCCAAFFIETWDHQCFIDTSWKMAEPSGETGHDNAITANVPPELNLLLRWLGIRPVFHLPCSLTCEPTIAIARDIASLARRLGKSEEIDTIYDMLNWPVQWSALHGIAEIETPVLRISTRTDATATKYTVRLAGNAAPVRHAVVGNRFPYMPPRNRQKARTIRDVPAPPLAPESQQWLYVDNGFHSLADMQQAFAPVVSVLLARAPAKVIHLACRNGALLHRAVQQHPTLRVAGVDASPDRVRRARQLLPAHAECFFESRLEDETLLATLSSADAYLVMVGRLLEMPPSRAEALLAAIRDRCDAILIYAFDDWLRRDSLTEMASRLNRHLAPGSLITSRAAAGWLN